MSTRYLKSLAVISACSLALVGCGSDSPDPADSASPSAAKGKVGVILPDSASSARWETADRQFLGEAFKAAGVEADIQNAGGDKAKFQTIADGMISSGVKALLIVNLDSETGAAVISKASQAGIPTIDYDRLTLGGKAPYYVSFDNVAVGTAIGDGLVKCLQDAGKTSGPVVMLNGSPTDNNATLFREGYAEGDHRSRLHGSRASRPSRTGTTPRPARSSSRCSPRPAASSTAVLAANDGLGGAAISVLETNRLAGKVPVTGQDATVEGLQRVLLGHPVHDRLQGRSRRRPTPQRPGHRAGPGRRRPPTHGDQHRRRHRDGPEGPVGPARAPGDHQGHREGRRRGRLHHGRELCTTPSARRLARKQASR